MLNQPIPWEWGDQGRAAYTHDFNNFMGIARGLVLHAGLDVRGRPDTLKSDLELATGLPFPPTSHTAWRNYSRIFRSLLLATEDPRKALRVTDVCKQLAKPLAAAWSVDNFLTFLAPRYYQPSPGRRGYDPNRPRVFPICVLLRYLAKNLTVTWEQTFDLLIGNGMEGNESLHKLALRSSGYAYTDSEKRQLREFMGYVSQFSFLTWDNNTLALIPGVAIDKKAKAALVRIATPISGGFLADEDDEVMRLGSLPNAPLPPVPRGVPLVPVPFDGSDLAFAEGTPKARTHLARERDPKLREAFFATVIGNATCDICGLVSELRYPWTLNGAAAIKGTIIELHHVLPLASAAYGGKTSVADLVPLCPSCHRAVHRYYLKWFGTNRRKDFPDKKTAKAIYAQAKKKYRP